MLNENKSIICKDRRRWLTTICGGLLPQAGNETEKKEPKSVHREKIASSASVLFMDKGIAATSMDDIEKAAGYSKATLYVHFKNKEEIVVSLRKSQTILLVGLVGEMIYLKSVADYKQVVKKPLLKK